ncbi:hypothetical protein DVH24_034470 [Malus domestica]|uniref:Uncharacterized protein n=1 Tax=Malus domestica TaxID=3750 RepID=A0A498IWL1_MALDO|nr:hypothetical protein DVH24_034470 [Malus domestica]
MGDLFQVNTHLTPRLILLTRHGESKDNVRGRIGGDNPLSQCWAVKHQRTQNGCSGDEDASWDVIRGKVGVAKIEGNMRENRFRWFGHVQRRPTDAPVRKCDYGTEVRGRRSRGRPRKTLEETLRKDLTYPAFSNSIFRETGASSSRSNTSEVDVLKEEVTTLKGRADEGVDKGPWRGVKAYARHMRDLVRAIQMFGLQISLPVPNLAIPSTFKPLRPVDSQI